MPLPIPGATIPESCARPAPPYAETGQFDKAIAIAQEALEITRAQRNEALTEDLQFNIANYQKQLPLRDPGVSER